MSPVISRRDAKTFLEFAGAGHTGNPHHPIWAAMERLRKTLAPKRSKAVSGPTRKQEKAKKRATKKEETAAIREAVMKRAGGYCEACEQRIGSWPLELDHMFGRGKAQQTVRNCWALCPECHRNKTNNRPSAAHWLVEFASHAHNLGFTSEARTARNRAAFVETRSALSRGEVSP